MEEWKPRTDLGRLVKSRMITDINEILDNGYTILEPEIVETLVPEMEQDLLLVGQSKGKFGGGRRRVFRQTQKKTREGNKPRFAAYAVVGNNDGLVGLGYGKARETVPARDKAIRKAKINVFKIARGSGSWEGTVDEPHTVPFTVEGKCGSVIIRLIPAPKGKGLVAEKEVQKILKAAGIEDVWMQSFGQTKNKINLIKATESALRKLTTTKLREKDLSNLKVHFGNTKKIAIKAEFEAVKDAQPQKPRAAQKPVPKAEKAPAKAEQPKPAPKPEAPEVKETPAPKVDAPKAEPVEKAAPVVETPPVKKQAGSLTDLTEVRGVGPATVDKLQSVGIMNAEQLAALTPEEVAQKIDVSTAVGKKMVKAAQSLFGGAE